MRSKESEIEKQYLLGNYQNALDLIVELEKLSYTSYKINEIEALIHLKKNQSRLALEKMKEAVKGDNFTDYSRFYFAELLIEDKKIEEAIEQLEKIKENNQIVIFKKIDCYLKISNLDKALENLKKISKTNHSTAEVIYNIARIYDEKNEDKIATEYYKRAIQLNPNLFEAYINIGTIFQKNKKYREAIEYYEKANKLNSNTKYLLGDIIYCYKNIFDYDKVKYYLEILKKTNKLLENIQPFQYLSISDSLQNQLKVSGNYLREKVNISFKKYQPHQKNKKIKIGYISADFKTHPTMHLVAELIEKHDQKKFEVILISLSEINISDGMTKRIINGKNKIINITALSSNEAIEYLRKQELDIAIDLMGYTTFSRPEIFKARVAPIQINYLGYPGSMNMKEMDFIIADKNLIPEESKNYYSEKILYLPDIFQPYDTSKSNISLNLSDENHNDIEDKIKDNFVFACFNSIHKVNENIIKVWAEILNKNHKSTLWLVIDDLKAQKNLLKIFKNLDIENHRIKFTKQVKYETYLQNMASADLFLDTWPFNAGATCRDAIWTGLPVLTMKGSSFAGRMSTSILLAANCPELVKNDINSYIETAVRLSKNPAEYSLLKLKVKKTRKTKLFDMQIFAKNIEDLFINVVERYH
jgi:predicted O-linked N-acetylglucosamine transferase (SPINDLY family)